MDDDAILVLAPTVNNKSHCVNPNALVICQTKAEVSNVSLILRYLVEIEYLMK